MATRSGLFLATIYNQSQLAERKHVARYWSINTVATAVPLSAHPSPLVISGGHIGRVVVRTRCSAGPVLPLWCQPSEKTPISLDAGSHGPTNVAQLHWRSFLSSRCCAHIEQSSAISNSVAISADFSEKTEDWTVSEIVCDQQFSVTQFFVTWPWCFFYLRHDNGTSFTK